MSEKSTSGGLHVRALTGQARTSLPDGKRCRGRLLSIMHGGGAEGDNGALYTCAWFGPLTPVHVQLATAPCNSSWHGKQETDNAFVIITQGFVTHYCKSFRLTRKQNSDAAWDTGIPPFKSKTMLRCMLSFVLAHLALERGPLCRPASGRAAGHALGNAAAAAAAPAPAAAAAPAPAAAAPPALAGAAAPAVAAAAADVHAAAPPPSPRLVGKWGHWRAASGRVLPALASGARLSNDAQMHAAGLRPGAGCAALACELLQAPWCKRIDKDGHTAQIPTSKFSTAC
eukprot:1158924-Pelagomonas_calceolata.AAC.21